MTLRQTLSRGLMILGLLGVGATVIAAQAGPLDSARGGPELTGGSVATLIAEVRQLRQSFEESAKNQAQTQALGVYLAAQQSRWLQVTNRLEAVRAEIATAAVQTREVSRLLATAEAEQAQPMSPEERTEAAAMTRWFKQQVDQATARDQQLRQRESELLQAYQTEESRWNDLIAQLERLVKR